MTDDYMQFTGAEFFDALVKLYPDARREYTPAQRCYVIGVYNAFQRQGRGPETAAWLLLPGGQGEPNNLDFIMTGDGLDVLNAAERGSW
jgi:hypothetical protein